MIKGNRNWDFSLLITLMSSVALMKLMAYSLCSSIPVPIVRIFGSKMMSLGLNPTLVSSS